MHFGEREKHIIHTDVFLTIMTSCRSNELIINYLFYGFKIKIFAYQFIVFEIKKIIHNDEIIRIF